VLHEAAPAARSGDVPPKRSCARPAFALHANEPKLPKGAARRLSTIKLLIPSG
jgi:hypothetical protein